MNKIFYAHFTAEKVGVEGLTDVTVDVDKIARSSGAVTAVGSGLAATEGRNGLYFYVLTSADEGVYDYLAVFKTADETVDQQEMAALRTDQTIQTGDAYARLGAPAGASLAADIAAVAGSLGLGAGSIPFSDTVDDGADPLDNVKVWATTDESGSNVYASTYTDADGAFTLHLDPGSETYWLWFELGRYNFSNPTPVIYNSGSGAFEYEE